MALKDFYKNAFEQKCIQLIIEAYQMSLKEQVIQLDWNENDISSELHRHIKANPLKLKSRLPSEILGNVNLNFFESPVLAYFSTLGPPG